jgi:hypothetical protein
LEFTHDILGPLDVSSVGKFAQAAVVIRARIKTHPFTQVLKTVSCGQISLRIPLPSTAWNAAIFSILQCMESESCLDLFDN